MTGGLNNSINTASLPGIVGSVGHGRLALRLRLPHRRRGRHRHRGWRTWGAVSPGGVGFDINCGVRFLALEATAQDIPNLKKLQDGWQEGFQPEVPERVALTSATKISTNCFNEVRMQPLIWATDFTKT